MKAELMQKRGYFITATNTEVGKTYIAAHLVKDLRAAGIDAGYYKPALSDAVIKDGVLVPGDAAYVCEVAGLSDEPSSLVSHIYTTPVSPHLAARLEGKPEVSLEKIRQDFARHSAEHELLIVEGCGGIVCPLREEPQLMLADVMSELDLPLIIVTPSGLGAINSCILTVEYARQKKMNIIGIIMNEYDESNLMHVDNARQIERLLGVKIIARVAQGATTLGLEDLSQ